MTPIELKLWNAARSDEDVFGELVEDAPAPHRVWHHALATRRFPVGQIAIGFQVPIHQYRVDFVVSQYSQTGTITVLVECDGHDFHERTKEQAARDRARDRYFQKMHPVYRFTGSEIWNDADGCWTEIKNFIGWQLDVQNETERSTYTSAVADTVGMNVSPEAGTLVQRAFYWPGVPMTWADIYQIGYTETTFAAAMRELSPYVSCSIDVRGRYVLRPSKTWGGRINVN